MIDIYTFHVVPGQSRVASAQSISTQLFRSVLLIKAFLESDMDMATAARGSGVGFIYGHPPLRFFPTSFFPTDTTQWMTRNPQWNDDYPGHNGLVC